VVKKTLATLGIALLLALPLSGMATPQQDLEEFRDYYKKRFPGTPFDDFVNGVYSIDKASREQWVEIEEFPPYELNISKGEELFNKPFANGKTYASCFENGGIGRTIPTSIPNAGKSLRSNSRSTSVARLTARKS
jgi:sulfur-oxidizing protein SoxA